MKKLAVIFPGIGYTAEKPLLYYAGKLAKEHGYETVNVAYSGFPEKVNLSGYGDILFIGKSIGTIAAAKLASESPLRDRIRLLLYTPLEDTFSFDFGEAAAFTGDADPWVGGEKSRISRICAERGIPCMRIPGANHSLETGNAEPDLRNLCRVMQETECFIRKMENGGDGR